MKRVDKFAKAQYVHRVRWVRVSPRWSAKRQIEMLDATAARLGITYAATYTTQEGDDFGHVLQAMMPDNEIYMAGLHRIAETVREARAHIAAVRKRRAKVYDAEAETWVDLASMQSLARMTAVINGERSMPDAATARERGASGTASPKLLRMSEKRAREIWFGPIEKYGNAEAKAEKIGLSKATLHRRFGPTGAPAGWPKKDRS